MGRCFLILTCSPVACVVVSPCTFVHPVFFSAPACSLHYGFKFKDLSQVKTGYSITCMFCDRHVPETSLNFSLPFWAFASAVMQGPSSTLTGQDYLLCFLCEVTLLSSHSGWSLFHYDTWSTLRLRAIYLSSLKRIALLFWATGDAELT